VSQRTGVAVPRIEIPDPCVDAKGKLPQIGCPCGTRSASASAGRRLTSTTIGQTDNSPPCLWVSGAERPGTLPELLRIVRLDSDHGFAESRAGQHA
jgi:hypothetical protein